MKYNLESFIEKYSEKKQETKIYNVYFIADTHINHKSILHYQPNRIHDLHLKGEDDVDGMDEYIYNMWDDMVKRGDHVYLLGDVFLGNQDGARKCIQRLKKKGANLHLIVGNHDRNIPQFYTQFASIDYIKSVTFKKSFFTFLDEDFMVCLCHYPMISWINKSKGAALVYGHVHSDYPFLDEETDDLMVNVGFDAPLSNYKLISLEQLWKYFKDKRGDLTANEYVNKIREKNPKFVG